MGPEMRWEGDELGWGMRWKGMCIGEGQEIYTMTREVIYLVAPSPTIGRNFDRAGPIQAAFSPHK